MKLIPDKDHPDGEAKASWFSRYRNRLYPDASHPDGKGDLPWFRIVGDEIFPDSGHPKGLGIYPWFKIGPGTGVGKRFNVTAGARGPALGTQSDTTDCAALGER